MAREDKTVLGWMAFVVAVFAVGIALFALRDSSEASESASGGGGAEATPVVEVRMSEFSFTPSMIEVPPGTVVLRLINDGTQVHNVSLPELSKKSVDVSPGTSVDFEVSGLAEGHYMLMCEIAGHAGAGMTGQLMVVPGSTGGGGTSEPPETMAWQEMDEMMDARNLRFPEETEGKGGQLMDYTVAADGAKVFEVTASIVDWEVEAGKIVEAWTYNGVVPAPEIHVEVGDLVRIVLTNELPESTAIHLHGIEVPNNMDGVPPYTQPPVQPGTTFTYEFVAQDIAVGIYHSHHNSQIQVPNGLFGAFTIGEMPIPEKLVDLGYGEITKTVNMVLNDSGTIGLSLNGKSFPATEPYTLKVGEVMLVNYLNEGLLNHPMHLHQPMGWIIAKDGVPLEEPIPGDTFDVAPGERYTVLYKAEEPGVWAWHCHILTHAEGTQGMFGMVTALIVEE